MGFFSSITKGLGKTRGGLLGTLTAVFTGRVDEEFFEELEETLICADVGVQCSLRICDQLRERCREAGVEFTFGTFFGAEAGEGFVRVNLACQHDRVRQTVDQLAKAILG